MLDFNEELAKFQPCADLEEAEENIYGKELEEIKKNKTELYKANQMIKKYNQALNYAKQGNDDLAMLQLKNVVAAIPNFVDAYLLMALLSIKEENYDDARQFLDTILKIDPDNESAVEYGKEFESKVVEEEPQAKEPEKKEKKKDKKNFGKVESAFLKDNTDVYDVTFQTEKSIKIKIEVDTCPPLNFKTEQKLLLQPHSFMTRCFTLPDLFAGKMHALVYRVWKNRVKGRDWYDFEWYVRHNVSLDFTHLAERCKQFNNENITPELFKEKLIERLSTADIKQVKEDVLPFVRNPKELDIWSNDYFVQLAGMVRIG